MNDERYQKIMSDLGMPNSRSLLQALQQVANEVGQQSSEEITRLRAELAKVTWQRNEAQAGLAASRAECERMRAILIQCDGIASRVWAPWAPCVGLCDAIDNDGDPYQSQHLADVLAGILAGEVKP